MVKFVFNSLICWQLDNLPICQTFNGKQNYEKSKSGSVARFFCIFSRIEPIWAPDKRSKWFFFKIRFRWDICEISDSALRKVRKINFRNQKLATTLRSQTLQCYCSLRESNNFFAFKHLNLQRTLPARLAPHKESLLLLGGKTTAFLPPMPHTFHHSISTGLNFIDWSWSSAVTILCHETDILYQCCPYS